MRKDTDTFNIQEWGSEPIHHYELEANDLVVLNAKLDELAAFCELHRLPFHATVGVQEGSERLRLAQRAVFPYARTNVAVLATNLLSENGINEYSINVLKELHQLDVNRNVHHVEKDAAAQERRAQLKVISPES